jgi:hypothetical protein
LNTGNTIFNLIGKAHSYDNSAGKRKLFRRGVTYTTILRLTFISLAISRVTRPSQSAMAEWLMSVKRYIETSITHLDGGWTFARHTYIADLQPTIMFIHGLGDSSLSFLAAFQSPRLKNFNIIAPWLDVPRRHVSGIGLLKSFGVRRVLYSLTGPITWAKKRLVPSATFGRRFARRHGMVGEGG